MNQWIKGFFGGDELTGITLTEVVEKSMVKVSNNNNNNLELSSPL